MSRAPKKTTRGKQKIEIKRIEDEDARYISFSKRRNGVFAKASDLSTLCGADMAVLIYSPTGRPHSFGSPNVDSVVDRFLYGSAGSATTSPAEHAYRAQVVQSLSRTAMQIAGRLEAGKTLRAELDGREAAACRGVEWMLQSLDAMGFHEVEQTRDLLEQLKLRVDGMLMARLQAGKERPPNVAATATATGRRGGWAPQPTPTAPSNRAVAVDPLRMVNPNGGAEFSSVNAASSGGF